MYKYRAASARDERHAAAQTVTQLSLGPSACVCAAWLGAGR